jgi:hypothetical protein
MFKVTTSRLEEWFAVDSGEPGAIRMGERGAW